MGSAVAGSVMREPASETNVVCEHSGRNGATRVMKAQFVVGSYWSTSSAVVAEKRGGQCVEVLPRRHRGGGGGVVPHIHLLEEAKQYF